MLDIKFIRDNPDKVKEGLKKKGVDFDLDHLLAVDEKRRAKIKEVDDLRSEQNAASDEIAKLAGEERAQKIAAAQGLKTGLSDSELELKALEEEFNQLINQIPNLPDDDVPVGRDESANQVVRRWGNVPQFSFEPKDHVALGEALDVIDTERASRVAGARFSYFKGEAALLEFALVQFTFGALISPEFLGKVADAVEDGYPAKPFTPVVPPVMINPEVFTKMARLNEQDKDERYYLPKDNLYLVGSAEHTLGPLHMGEIVDEDKLPIRYVGFSTSFRREAGSYGKDTRGVLRVHQFDKIEMESFTTPENSRKEQDFIVAIQEQLVQALGIPYQVVMISTGDMGKPDTRQIDIECWLPGQGKYRETHTSDLMTDYQARRLNSRLRRKDGRIELLHMNDATAFAIGRIIIAILENYQQEDGSVKIPEALWPYMHGIKVIESKARS